MGLLDSIVGSLTGGGEGQSQLLQLVTDLIAQHGGVESVVQTSAAHGMGAEAQQWVGTDPNAAELQDNIAGLLKGGTDGLGLGDLAKLFGR